MVSVAATSPLMIASPLRTVAIGAGRTIAAVDFIVLEVEIRERQAATSDRDLRSRLRTMAIGKKLPTPPAPPIAWLLRNFELEISPVVGPPQKAPSEIAPPVAAPPPTVLAPPCAMLDWKVEPSMVTLAP